MANTVNVEIITPTKTFFRGACEMIIVNTLDGEEGFMAGHSWACKLLKVGELWVREAGSSKYRAAAVSEGFIDVKDSIIVYTDTAEWKDEIDVERAKRSKEDAEAWLNNTPIGEQKEDEIARAQVAIAKAISRIKVAESSFRN